MKLDSIKALVVGMEKSGRGLGGFSARARFRCHNHRHQAARSSWISPANQRVICRRLGSDRTFPGVPADLEPLQAARNREVDVIGEIELAAPFLRGKVIGITGSNGKTTTTSLVGHILSSAGVPAQVGGNIGTPVTAMTESSATISGMYWSFRVSSLKRRGPFALTSPYVRM